MFAGAPGWADVAMDKEQQQREEARDRVEDMPAETAAGNADRRGPSMEDPQQWEDEHPGPTQ
jgi:hypothetical protein